MLEGISTNAYSSQLRTNISEGVRPNSQKEFVISHSEEQKQDASNLVKKEKLKDVVESMNTFLEPTHTSVRFEFHEKLNEYFVKVVDDVTEETIREIPPKKLLDFYAAMTEFVGLMVDKKI